MQQEPSLPPIFLLGQKKTGFQSFHRCEGQAYFLRLGDEERLSLTFELIDAWERSVHLQKAAAAAAFRQAWDSEPCIGGRRLGSYLTECFRRSGCDVYEALQSFLDGWGYHLMDPCEKRALTRMTFPRTVYRGGAGDKVNVEHGFSWTLDLGVANFYATSWPSRFGDLRPPVVLSAVVDKNDVCALLLGRKEQEVLLPHLHDYDIPIQVVTV